MKSQLSPLLRRPTASPGHPAVRVDPGDEATGWQYVSFRALHLPAGGRIQGSTGREEVALIVLGGTCVARAGGQSFEHLGDRTSVWDRTPPHLLVLSPGTEYALTAGGEPVHLAIAGAAATTPNTSPPRLVRPGDVLVEHRGEGQTARTVHHLLPPKPGAADRLIAFEVYTPGGNWSSFPPHKHDTEDPPRESFLEEVYYYGIQPSTGFALQRVYTTDRSLDETIAAQDGDLVLVPRGYHVVSASPGHDCYYLNVMAGPGRAWHFAVAPDYASLMNWTAPT